MRKHAYQYDDLIKKGKREKKKGKKIILTEQSNPLNKMLIPRILKLLPRRNNIS